MFHRVARWLLLLVKEGFDWYLARRKIIKYRIFLQVKRKFSLR